MCCVSLLKKVSVYIRFECPGFSETAVSMKGGGGEWSQKRSAKHHCKVLHDNIQGITKPAIRWLARHRGAKHILGLIDKETHGVLKVFMENATHDATLILRCWLFLSLQSRIRQALDCSPTNRERKLGLDRHGTG
uniref:Uncharacterized protein n=1 Tax=Eptatretus burgeri TaxID=7764 RepID=A0A8C4Q686_EPTBU